jgi:hypothetical protein
VAERIDRWQDRPVGSIRTRLSRHTPDQMLVLVMVTLRSSLPTCANLPLLS